MSNERGSIQRVFTIAFVLAAFTFVLMLVYGPVEGRRPGQGGAFVPSSVSEQAARIRRALVSGRADAAVSIADETASLFPDDRETWLWVAQVHHTVGSPDIAAQAGVRLEAMVIEQGVPNQLLLQSTHTYRLAWANLAMGRTDTARALFLQAARIYESAPPGMRADDRIAYNLACYLAMAGEDDRAAAAFARAVELGYADDEGWWRADPDLDPIRSHPVYMEAAKAMAALEEDRRWITPRRNGVRRIPPEFEAGWSDPSSGN